MEPKISIVVPIYNVDVYLKQCIESLVFQSYKNIEIVLVDDGSTDNSPAICDEYESKDSRIKVIHKQNGGVTSARQSGIFASTGDYLMLVDGDDWIEEDTIHFLVIELNNNPKADLIVFSHIKDYPRKSYIRHLFDGNRRFYDEEAKIKVYRRLFGITNQELDHPESMDYFSTCWGKLYRRDFAKKARFVSTDEVGSCEDGIFNMYALDQCKCISYIDQPYYHYRHAEGSLTKKYRCNFITQWNRLFAIMKEKNEEIGSLPDFCEALNNRISLSVLGIALNELNNPYGDFFQFKRYIKSYINSNDYRLAITTLKIKKLPFAWKVLMFCCKYRLSFSVALILKMIKIIKTKL